MENSRPEREPSLRDVSLRDISGDGKGIATVRSGVERCNEGTTRIRRAGIGSRRHTSHTVGEDVPNQDAVMGGFVTCSARHTVADPRMESERTTTAAAFHSSRARLETSTHSTCLPSRVSSPGRFSGKRLCSSFVRDSNASSARMIRRFAPRRPEKGSHSQILISTLAFDPGVGFQCTRTPWEAPMASLWPFTGNSSVARSLGSTAVKLKGKARIKQRRNAESLNRLSTRYTGSGQHVE